MLSRPGYYTAFFHATLSPIPGDVLPVSAVLYLTRNGASVTGTGARQSLTQEQDAENISFVETVRVSDVPATLNVFSEGSMLLVSDAAITVIRLGDL